MQHDLLLIVFMLSIQVTVEPSASHGTVALLNVFTLQLAPNVDDVAVDSQGRLLAANNDNGLVYRILPTGSRTTLAMGFSYPCGITVDNATDIAYVADSVMYCIKSVTSTGVITVIAGLCGTAGYTDGVGTAAKFNLIVGIVFHASRALYVCDHGNSAVRKINITTTMVTTVGAAAPLSLPYYLCINRAGSTLYVSSFGNNVVVRIDLVPTTPTMTTIAGSSGNAGYNDGVGSSARFNGPAGIALQEDETMLFVADRYNYRIRSIRLSDGAVRTAAGDGINGYKDGPTVSAQFTVMFGIKWFCNASSSTHTCGLLVADYRNNNVRWITSTKNNITTSLSTFQRPTMSASSSGTASLVLTVSTTIIAATPTSSPQSATESFSAMSNTTVVSTSETQSPSASSLTTTSGSESRTASLALTVSTTLTAATPTSSTPTVTTHSLDTEQTHSFTAIVPPPMVVFVVETLREGIAATTPLLQYSLGAVSTSARSISRMGVVSKIGNCQSPFSPPQGLLSSRIEGCGATVGALRSIEAEYARGDAVLAVVVLLCVSGLILVCCTLYGHVKHLRLRDSAAALSMPSLLLPLWGAALPTGVNGIAALSRNWEGCAGDGVLLVFDVAVVFVLPMTLLVCGTMAMLQRLQIVRRVATAAALSNARCAPLQRAIRVALHRQWTWEPQPGTTTLVHLYGRVVVLQHRVLWYATLDMAVLVAVSALAAAAVDLPLGTCQALGGVIVALLSLQLLVCGVSRPFTTLFDHVVAMTTLTLNVAGAAVQLSLLMDGSTPVLAAAAALDLLLLGVSGLKAALDSRALMLAAKRRWKLLTTSELKVLDEAVVGSLGLDDYRSDHRADNTLKGPMPLVVEDDVELDTILLAPSRTRELDLLTTADDAVISSLALAYAAMSAGWMGVDAAVISWEEGDVPDCT